MTKMISKVSIAALMAGTMLSPALAEVSIEGNIGITTDYIWRGMSQNAGGTSASGGLDVDYGNGFYAGTWVGDTAASDSPTTEADFGTQEVDVYFGYSAESGSLTYDVGYIAYMYPSSQSDANDADFSEAYLTLGSGAFSLSYYYLVEGDDADAGDSSYIELGYETELSNDFGLSLSYGVYDGDFVGDDSVTNIVATLSKGDFSLALVTTDSDNLTDTADEDARMVASWGVSF